MSQSGQDGANSSGNHPTSGIAGGTSAKPTPANNVGGGAGWGDKGFFKGGSDQQGTGAPHEGLGHVANPRSSFGNFFGLQEQKTRAENKFMEKADLAAADAPPTTESGEPTCAGEDHSFMQRKPGCPDTLPGWEKAKDVLGA
ncbi:hypothetical protein N7474_003254 [Penicillium riverlandense]|uniref:uncharacterized protein n=1 Tax=Penicillium riverlandense TaxID=1903569 RepID=UPI002546C31E|nr:uncharacterized protein N7474_003254 [Penicillium riverlandense]KAJ5826116.1 hypothetical protein N7474_003254 [Penicillium riverlandense]